MTVINRVLKGGGDGKKYGADISTFLGDVDSNGILQNGNTTDLVFKGVKDIGAIDSTAGVLARRFQYNTGIKSVSFPDLEKLTPDYGMSTTFYICTGITSVDLSSLKEVSGAYAFYYSFSGCTSITSIDLSSLREVSGERAFSNSFSGCTGITSVDLSSLTILSGKNAYFAMFSNCTNLTSVNFSSLTTISDGVSPCQGMFSGCTNLTNVSFPVLKTITSVSAFVNCFYACTSLRNIYFPALTTSSFGSAINQFDVMINGVTGCTLHFPSNLSSTISGLSGYPKFGGTNTVLAFDLPATE